TRDDREGGAQAPPAFIAGSSAGRSPQAFGALLSQQFGAIPDDAGEHRADEPADELLVLGFRAKEVMGAEELVAVQLFHLQHDMEHRADAHRLERGEPERSREPTALPANHWSEPFTIASALIATIAARSRTLTTTPAGSWVRDSDGRCRRAEERAIGCAACIGCAHDPARGRLGPWTWSFR